MKVPNRVKVILIALVLLLGGSLVTPNVASARRGGSCCKAPARAPRQNNNKGPSNKAPTNKNPHKNGPGTKVNAPQRNNNRAPSHYSGAAYHAPTGPLRPIGTHTRASGSHYTMSNGSTYYYHRPMLTHYYSVYHGGYPLMTSLLFWSIIANPYYGPNYSMAFSPWYGHMYPVGYHMVNGQLVANPSHAGLYLLYTAIGLLIVFGVFGIIIWALNREPKTQYTSRNFG